MNASADAMPLAVPVGDRDHMQGPPDAPVTLVEYGDYECPHCGAVHSIVKEIQRQMGEQLRLVFRHFPLPAMHPHAMRAAEAAEAAGGQGKFWEMHDVLFTTQQKLADEDLVADARSIGLDIERFRRDLAQHSYLAPVQEDFRGGRRSGVKSTPTFFINGVRHTGAYDLEPLLAAVKAAAGHQ